jgi:excisionase family DNA binding protein
MAALAIKMDDVHEPSAEEIDAARIAARQLSRVQKGVTVSFKLERSADSEADGDAAEPISVPANIFRIFIDVLKEVGNGNTVAVVPVTAELTTQQAADLLNVSRPHLIKLLDERKLHHRMVGTHRKLLAQDVLAYRDKITHDRREALARLVEMDEELGLYDDEPVGSKDL